MSVRCIGFFAAIVGASFGAFAESRSASSEFPYRQDYFSLEAFPELPSSIKADLERRGCSIPKAILESSDEPYNVIRGRFLDAKQSDWAVLCARGSKKSTILIYPDDASTSPIEIAEEEFAAYGRDGLVRDFVEGEAVHINRRVIRTANKAAMEAYTAYGGSIPSDVDHDGIDDGDTITVVRYFRQGKWLELPGGE